MNKKELIGILLFIIIMVTLTCVGLNRINKINDGTIIQVSESYMK